MFKCLIQNIADITQEAIAIVDPAWNHKFRPINDDFYVSTFRLPYPVKHFLASCEDAIGVEAHIMGGAFGSIERGEKPNDYDGYLVGQQHPVLMLRQLTTWAHGQGHTIIPHRRRVSHLWKRVRIQTKTGELFDLGCLSGNFGSEVFAACSDVSTCARSATLRGALVTARYMQGEMDHSLIFTQLQDARDHRRHLKRWLKNAVQKHPDRAVHYQSAEDAERFAELNYYRPQLTEIYHGLTDQNLVPKRTGQWLPYLRNVGISEQQCRLFIK